MNPDDKETKEEMKNPGIEFKTQYFDDEVQTTTPENATTVFSYQVQPVDLKTEELQNAIFECRRNPEKIIAAILVPDTSNLAWNGSHRFLSLSEIPGDGTTIRRTSTVEIRTLSTNHPGDAELKINIFGLNRNDAIKLAQTMKMHVPPEIHLPMTVSIKGELGDPVNQLFKGEIHDFDLQE